MGQPPEHVPERHVGHEPPSPAPSGSYHPRALAIGRAGSQLDSDGPKSDKKEGDRSSGPGHGRGLADAPKGQGAALAVGRGGTETGLAFTHEDGRALTPGGVSQRFDRFVARHKIPPIRLHDLRQVMTCARGRDPGFDRRRRHQGGLRAARAHHHPDHPRHLPQRYAAGRARRRRSGGRAGTGPRAAEAPDVTGTAQQAITRDL
jgi:hypothetical protein